MANNIQIEKIRELLNTTFHGGAWHGSSVLEITKGLNAKVAGTNIGNVHTIAELIYHITSWRIFACKRIQGDDTYNIEGEKMNWGNFAKIDQFDLETLMMEMTLSHEELNMELESKTDKILDDIVPGCDYTYFTLLNGIIHHDLYHTGQMAIIKKVATKNLKNDGFEDYENSGHYDDDFDENLL